jgi:hypothetical protein
MDEVGKIGTLKRRSHHQVLFPIAFGQFPQSSPTTQEGTGDWGVMPHHKPLPLWISGSEVIFLSSEPHNPAIDA